MPCLGFRRPRSGYDPTLSAERLKLSCCNRLLPASRSEPIESSSLLLLLLLGGDKMDLRPPGTDVTEKRLLLLLESCCCRLSSISASADARGSLVAKEFASSGDTPNRSTRASRKSWTMSCSSRSLALSSGDQRRSSQSPDHLRCEKNVSIKKFFSNGTYISRSTVLLPLGVLISQP